MFLVIYISNEEDEFDSVYVDKRSTVDLSLQNKDVHTFMGWYTGEEVSDAQFIDSSLVNQNITLYFKIGN